MFGEIKSGEMVLNDAGTMVGSQWLALPNRFSNIALHECVVMPNHFHGIVQIVEAAGQAQGIAPTTQEIMIIPNDGQAQGIAPTTREIMVGATLVVAPTTQETITPNKTIGDIVGAFKSVTTVEYIRGVKNLGWRSFNGKLWQRNYYEHIVRSETSYQRIAEYIINNPAQWADDTLNKS
jgi:REP element-mobilizing transposase RayT